MKYIITKKKKKWYIRMFLITVTQLSYACDKYQQWNYLSSQASVYILVN